MSLKDTIRGARDEVAASGNPFENMGGKGKDKGADKGKPSSGGSAAKRGYARSSAANRKPSREAAAGVRVVSSSGKTKAKSTANMTKEERKEEKRLEREKEDRRYSVTQMILEKDEEYQKARKFWWRFLIGGFVLMVIALGLYGYVSNVGPTAPPIAYIGSIVAMVAAYGVIIVGIIFDFRKIRPRRKAAEQRVASMTDKKVQSIVNRGSI